MYPYIIAHLATDLAEIIIKHDHSRGRKTKAYD